MGISEAKKKIVIDNYFKVECDMNTSIKEAFTKGFELGLKKAPQPKTGRYIEERTYMECPNCHDVWHYEENQTERFKFCPTCGERIK